MAESQEPQAPPETQVSEAQIAVHWREEEYYPPPPASFTRRSSAGSAALPAADVGDVTTLANPEIVEDIRYYVQSAKVTRDDVPRDLTEAEFEEIKKFGSE